MNITRIGEFIELTWGAYLDVATAEQGTLSSLPNGVVVEYQNPLDQGWLPLNEGDSLDLANLIFEQVRIASNSPGKYKLAWSMTNDSGIKSSIEKSFHVVNIELRVDSDRDGVVSQNEAKCDQWTWGPNGSGAIMLVNNDRDQGDTLGESEYVDVVIAAPGHIPPNHSLHLTTNNENTAKKFGLYRETTTGQRKLVLGMDEKAVRRLPTARSGKMTVDVANGLSLKITGWRYPDEQFDGFVPLTLHLVDDTTNKTVTSAHAVLRVAPWMMLPHSLEAERVFVSDLPGPNDSTSSGNTDFIAAIKSVLDAQSPSIPLTIATGADITDRDRVWPDRWMQDELEIGFTQGSQHDYPVVFDLPRDRGLDPFPETLQAPEFGWFSLPKGSHINNGLEAGGNLEVTPPFTAHGIHYPHGRIVYGGGESFKGPTWPVQEAREFMPTMRKFFAAQVIQKPIELFTDWLIVGHIDEVISFIPAPHTARGFVVASASVQKAHDLLKDLHRSGQGNNLMFAGKERIVWGVGTEPAEITVTDLLSDTEFWKVNNECAKFQSVNEEILIRELDLQSHEIVHIPTLFKPESPTVAYFPGMVNSLVLGGGNKSVLVPKPYGPVDQSGIDIFEKAYRDALPWMDPKFIDNWYSYHELSGEVHCGTNVQRKIPQTKWWHAEMPNLPEYRPS